jgi:hypothetical protein
MFSISKIFKKIKIRRIGGCAWKKLILIGRISVTFWIT